MNEIFSRLTKLLENEKPVYIMAHQNTDLDAIGASLALYHITEQLGGQPYIVLKNVSHSNSVSKALQLLEKAKINIHFLSSIEQLENPDTALLIILDTHKKEMLEIPELLPMIKKVVILDHHVKGNHYIKETIFSYINANLSSTNEIMVEYLRYLNYPVPPTIATIMLAGMEIDTSGFNLKTSDRTYEAAAFLMKQGADSVIKQELLKENKEEYLRRQAFVKKSVMINDHMAMCLLDNQIYKKEELSMISEELLQFEDVGASFTIGRITENMVGISARSLGEINVERIMKEMGGGGHVTDAATQIKDATLDQVKKQLLNIVNHEDEVKK